jgi:hypothetical protein
MIMGYAQMDEIAMILLLLIPFILPAFFGALLGIFTWSRRVGFQIAAITFCAQIALFIFYATYMHQAPPVKSNIYDESDEQATTATAPPPATGKPWERNYELAPPPTAQGPSPSK